MNKDLAYPLISVFIITYFAIFFSQLYPTLPSFVFKMLKVIDVSTSCELCHKQHHVVLPKNFCIWIPLRLDENVLPYNVDDVVLDLMFIVHSPIQAIKQAIGEEFLVSSALHFLYPSNMASIFLSNAMDLMQSPLLL